MKSNFVVGTYSNLLQENDIKKLSHKQKETLEYSTECSSNRTLLKINKKGFLLKATTFHMTTNG